MADFNPGEVRRIPEVIQSVPASAVDAFLYGWWEESQKRNIPLLNDVLRSLMTLSTALSGSSLLFLNQVDVSYRLGAATFFLLALIVSLKGILPFEGRIRASRPDEILAHKQKAQEAKKIHVQAAAALIVIGLVVVGIAVASAR